MLRFVLTPEGTAYSDFTCDDAILKFIDESNDGYDVEVRSSTENIFNSLRVAVHEGRISEKDVVINLGDYDLKIDSDGRLPDWGNYSSPWDLALDKLLKL